MPALFLFQEMPKMFSI
uniref:Uncharacterized protein n=1 Tax=Mus musculus TaxID=10090 RepID=Q3TQK4_MOUSE|nr:unnamed protein product [Mus musculus]